MTNHNTDTLLLQNKQTPVPAPHIYFRTDGNSEIATGHLMRCLSIARACVKMGASVSFILSDKESLQLIEDRFASAQEFETHCLDSDFKMLPPELPVLLSYIREKESASDSAFLKPWIFVDSYYATPAYLDALGKVCRTAYLDDLRSFDCPVDLVINYDTDEDCPHYDCASRRLLGIQYTPLRDQFHTPVYEVRSKAEHVLLSTGGTDPFGVAQHLLETVYGTDESIIPLTQTAPTRAQSGHCEPAATVDAGNILCPGINFSTLRSLHYHILTSRANTCFHTLTDFARTHSTVHIHEGVTDVASLMASCDLAVSAGGTTLCELCAVGVPTVSYLMADNQHTAVESYAGHGLIPWAGDIRPADSPMSKQLSVNPEVVANILAFLTSMSQNFAARKENSQKMRVFLNGTGADLIALALLS